MSRTLDSSELAALLKKPPQAKEKARASGYPPPLQFGPIRFTDTERRCVSSGYYVEGSDGVRVWKKTQGSCGSPTTHMWKGIPLCVYHILDRANELLYELGVES